ncbi:PAS/PAC and GAF sensor-containing diguanylate cyclase/phosphodiesterase [Candidatus Omnitrophus magneticus]|uniref:PAS/PAC and GAF sensor-containing diguanylate cyclase/phosphodiesterase n=1 Tax=Candidatus Omnitrophus magneticus TaxID=1609969 RepID=A0A0F0CP56_9BACT|nr:PAS/PAC and GAF sensor-containing diguanylate cyclase/phosphodiesterase [Candidatus Omnitrophus magneticus]
MNIILFVRKLAAIFIVFLLVLENNNLAYSQNMSSYLRDASNIIPTSRVAPTVDVINNPIEKEYIVTGNPADRKILADEFKEEFALLYLSKVMGWALKLGIGESGVKEMLAKHFSANEMVKIKTNLVKVQDGFIYIAFENNEGTISNLVFSLPEAEKNTDITIPPKHIQVSIKTFDGDIDFLQGKDKYDIDEQKKGIRYLDYFYRLSTYVDKPGVNNDDLWRKAMELFPTVWKNSYGISAKVDIAGNGAFVTKDFSSEGWSYSAEIVINNKRFGVITIYRSDEKKENVENKGDIALIDMFALHFGKLAEKIQIKNKFENQYDFLMTVLEALPYSFYVVDVKNYKIVYANSASGIDKVLGEITCHSLTHKSKEPCGSKEHLCPLEEILKTKQHVAVSHVHYDVNGKPRNMEVHAYPIFDENGKITHMIEYSIDITERKKQEEVIRSSEEWSSLAMEAANVARFEIELSDPSNPNLICGDDFKRLIGINKKVVCEDFLEEFIERIHPTERVSFREELNSVIQYGYKLKKELRVKTVDNSYNYIIISGKIFNHSIYRADSRVLVGIIQDVSEQKEIEEKLRQSEERYALAQDASNSGSWDWDIVTGRLFWTKKIYEVFGFTGKYEGQFKMTYKAFFDIIHPDDIAFVKKEVDNALAGTKEYDIRHRILWPDGKTIRWVSEKGKVFRDKEGKANRMVGMVQDITEQVENEEKIKHAAKEWRKTFDSIEDMIFILDKDRTIIRANKSFYDSIGATPVLTVGKKCHEIMHDTNSMGVDCPFKAMMKYKKTVTTEVFEPKFNKWFLITVSPILNETGGIIGAIHIAKDLTEIKKIEKEVVEKDKRIRDIFSAARGVALILTDISGDEPIIKEFSVGAELMFGYKEGEIANKKFLDNNLSEDMKFFFGQIDSNHYGSTINVSHNEIKLKKRNGEEFFVLVFSYPITDSYGRLTGILDVITDITNLKQAEKFLQESERRFRNLVTNIPGAVYQRGVREKWPLEFISDKIFNISGYKAKDFVEGKIKYEEIIHPFHVKKYKNVLVNAVISRQPYVIEYRIKNSNGEYVWVEERGQSACNNGDDEICWIDAVIIDINVRKKIEIENDELRKKLEKRMREINYRDQVGAILNDLEETTDLKLEKIVKMFPHVWEQYQNIGARISLIDNDKREKIFTGENLVKGSWKPVKKVPIKLNDEIIGGVEVFFSAHVEMNFSNEKMRILEYTAEKLSNYFNRRKREDDKENFKNIFLENPLPMHILDSLGRIIDVNNKELELFGYTREEMVGKEIFDFIAREERESAKARFLDKLSKNGSIKKIPRIYVRKDGTKFIGMANDSLVKDANDKVIEVRTILEDVTEREEEREHEKYKATHDTGLTGLPNRSLLYERLDTVIARIGRHRNGEKVAVLFFDLNSFKKVNDTIGHDAGDKVLKYIADLFSKEVREVDTFARLGGDEFVVVLTEVKDEKDVKNFIEKRLIKAIKDNPFEFGKEYEGIIPPVSFSMGVSFYSYGDNGGQTVSDKRENLLKKADVALYSVKEIKEKGIKEKTWWGDTLYAVFNDTMQARFEEEKQFENDFKMVLEKNQLELNYSPRFNLKGDFSGLEIELKWNHPEKGHICYAGFMNMMKKFNMEMPIMKWMLEDLFRQRDEWLKKGLDIPIVIPFKNELFKHVNFIKQFGEVVSRSPNMYKNIEIELSEESINEDKLYVNRVMRQLNNEFNVKFSISGFGTGHFSIKDLKSLPISSIKLDKRIIENMFKNKDDESVVSATINMANTLGVKVLMENISTGQEEKFMLDSEQATQGIIGGYSVKFPVKGGQVISIFGNIFSKHIKDVSIDLTIDKEKKYAESFKDTIFLKALEKARKNENIIIGIDTSWIPKAYIQPLLNKLNYFAVSKGFHNVVIERADGTALAGVLDDIVKKRKASLSSVIIIGSGKVLNDDAFSSFRAENNVSSGAFFAIVDYGKDWEKLKDNDYIRLLEILEISLKLAFGEMVSARKHPAIDIKKMSSRECVLIPLIEPADETLLRDIYKAEKNAIMAA